MKNLFVFFMGSLCFLCVTGDISLDSISGGLSPQRDYRPSSAVQITDVRIALRPIDAIALTAGAQTPAD
jgi:hypothetical protein